MPILLACCLSAGCASPQAGDTCDITYSPIPHVNSSETIGDQLLKDVFELSTESQKSLFKDLIPVTESIFNDIGYIRTNLDIKSHRLIVGGYEGITTPSINIEVEVNSVQKMDALNIIAAAMGQIYVQDSVLTLCPDDGQQTGSEMMNYILSDVGRKRFFSEENVQVFYGMMIAAFNDPDVTGYSYYPSEGVVTTFSSLEANDDYYEKIKSVTDLLSNLSGGDIQIDIQTEVVDVGFPHNDWQNHPNGHEYLALLSGVIEAESLESYRDSFLELLEEHTSRR